jgi:hypothetical protein
MCQKCLVGHTFGYALNNIWDYGVKYAVRYPDRVSTLWNANLLANPIRKKKVTYDDNQARSKRCAARRSRTGIDCLWWQFE